MAHLTAPIKGKQSLPNLNSVLMQWKIEILGWK
jgi:hypothetical protein